MTTGWVWEESYAWHNTGNGAGWLPAGGFVQPLGHIDSPESKSRFRALLEVSGLLHDLVTIRAIEASDERLLRFHTQDYLNRLAELNDSGGDAGEYAPFGPGGYSIARLAAGGVIEAVRAVVLGNIDNAYALVRPAGHHAEADRGRGFCILGNVAVAAMVARAELDVGRIAIVDWDVHHGNGTQAAFWTDPNTLTISMHQEALYPLDSGTLEEIGEGPGRGTALNVPLPPGCGDGAYISVMERIVAPTVARFRPDIIMVASGFDAAVLDPLGRMMVTSRGYRRMTRILLDLATDLCDGRVVFAHEGGYSPVYVPFCGLAVVEELSGIMTGAEDPFLEFLGAYPHHEVQPHQEATIKDAESAARGIAE